MRPRRALVAALVIVAAAALGLVVRQAGLGAVRVAGTSMRDTLSGGDVALVTRFDYVNNPPRRGDVVQCRFPGRSDTYIKRVIGLPGDEVVYADGRLTLNGAAVSEPYVSSPTDDFSVRLGENQFLALGDNRADSYDSRMEDMGPIGAEAFLGRVRWVIWPLDRIGPVR